jgi:hypothetical protein
LRFVHWSVSALAAGVYPTERHDGAAWAERDARRASLGGQRLRYRGAIVRFKGDWSEFCEILGLPTWASNTRPCFTCNALPDKWCNPEGVSVLSFPWHVNEDADYEVACSRAELWARLTEPIRLQLIPPMSYDRRHHGPHGRTIGAVTEDLAALGLKAGDRLEPCSTLPDVAT